MKKIYNIAISLLALAGFSACVEDEHVVFHPEDTKAQVLQAFADATLSADGANLTTTFDAAVFGVDAPVQYALYVAASGSEEGKKIGATIALGGEEPGKGTVTVAQKDLNAILNNIGGVPDVEFTADIWLEGYLCNDKGNKIESSLVKSNVTTSKFVPYSTTILDVDVYDHVWVIGTFNGWSHDNVIQYLYNYNKDGKTFEGVIDYGTDAASGWKLTGIAGWDDSCNWGSPDQAEADEAPSVTLISAGSSKDIKCYGKRFYKWSFDKSSLVLTKVNSFNNIGLVGTINSWNPADPATKMEYNQVYHRFYIDFTFEAGSEIKFTCDDAWDVNFGAGCAQGGDNIGAPEGSYRVYLDLNKLEYSFNADMFGKEEPGLPSSGDDPDPDPELPEGARPVNVLCEDPGWDNANLYGWGMKTSIDWPGLAMTKIELGGVAYWYYTLEAKNWASEGVGLIFNNGSVQTVDIQNVVLDGEKCYKLGDLAEGKLTYSEAAVPVVKITYKNEAGWENVNLYGWGNDCSFGLGDWPGTAMAKEGDVWVYSLPAEHIGKSVSLIFNNGAGAQTVDLGPFDLVKDYDFDSSNAAIK